MLELDIGKFCGQNAACKEGREWALANCADMEEAWYKMSHRYLIWTATCPDVLSDEQLVKFVRWLYQGFLVPFNVPPEVHKAWLYAERYSTDASVVDEYSEAMLAARDFCDRLSAGLGRNIARAALTCCIVPVTGLRIYESVCEIEYILCRSVEDGLRYSLPPDMFSDRTFHGGPMQEVVENCLETTGNWYSGVVANYIRCSFGNPFYTAKQQRQRQRKEAGPC